MEVGVSYERGTPIGRARLVTREGAPMRAFEWQQATSSLANANVHIYNYVRIMKGMLHAHAWGHSIPSILPVLQGYLAHKKAPPPRTLQYGYA